MIHTPARDRLLYECISHGARFVGNRGNVYGPVVFIGEAPGADEDSAGYPFVGPSGRLLDTMVSEAGFEKSSCWFTNVYKIRPPDNDLERLPELGIDKQHFINEFLEELSDYKPTFIVVCGATPLSTLCPFTIDARSGSSKISHWRGSLLTSPQLPWPHYIFPIYHPAFVLREWSEKYFNTFLLCKLRAELDFFTNNHHLNPLPNRENIVEPSFDEALVFLRELLESPECISIDIELLRRKIPYCISFAKNSTSACSIGLADYTDEQSARLFLHMDKIFWTKNVVGQNYFNFDAHYLRACGFRVNTDLVDDTRIRHNTLWPELPHKLEVLCMQYTREPYYKEEGRSWNKLSGTGKKQLMRYNNKDTLVTREAFDVQELEFNANPELRKFYYEHELPLARAMHRMEHRGIQTDPVGLSNLSNFIKTELKRLNDSMRTRTGKTIVFDAGSAKTQVDAINVNSPQQLITLLKSRGLQIPKTRGSNGQPERETTSEDKLHVLFGESGDEVLKEILEVRELSKIQNTYISGGLVNGVLYSDYVVGGTVTGRRSSRGWPLGFGFNGQNIPKHSVLGKKFRRCLVARSGKILLSCDQVSAEDWVVQGIIADVSGDEGGVNELKSGIDRHCKLAMFVFGLPETDCNKTAERNGKIFRYVGKRTRHAGHYGMRGNKLSAVLAKEGFTVPSKMCDFLLERFHMAEPNIRGVFQHFIEREVSNKRRLTNLFGRRRDFFGFCPYRDNSEVFREAYSYIPQGTVGDNTGEAMLVCTRYGDFVVLESHDALTLEIDDNLDSIFFGVQLLKKAFKRTLRFQHGYELEIPIEFELGYNFKDTVACGDLNKIGLMNTLTTLQQLRSPQDSTTSGAQLVSLPQP